MSPIDDELRTLLHSRADAVPPAGDPMAGVERRAQSMRRNRAAASIAGAALAVAAVAVAVPFVVSDRDARPVQLGSTPSASAAPSPSTVPATPAPAAALDPQHPWDYRGDRALLANVASMEQEWASVHPGSRLTPLYGEVYEASRRPQITFVADDHRWGVMASSEAGWTLLHDEALAPDTTTLMAALPADEVPRLQVVSAPSTGEIEYAADGTTFKPLTSVQPGVAYTPLEGDTSSDAVRVLNGDGDIDHPVFVGPAPDFVSRTPASPVAHPSNYLEWQPRGTANPRLESQAVMAYARTQSVDFTAVGHSVIWSGTDTYGRGLIVLQAWVGTGLAQTFGFVSTGEPFLGPVLGKDPSLLAYVASGPQGSGRDVLVLLPRPGAGPFSYASSVSAPYTTVGNARSDLQNVAVLDRDQRATDDRVKVLDGDGMHVLYQGALQPFLCGASGCG
jgi:hypothetical protein